MQADVNLAVASFGLQICIILSLKALCNPGIHALKMLPLFLSNSMWNRSTYDLRTAEAKKSALVLKKQIAAGF